MATKAVIYCFDSPARISCLNKEADGRFGGLMVPIDPRTDQGAQRRATRSVEPQNLKLLFFVDFAMSQVEARNSS